MASAPKADNPTGSATTITAFGPTSPRRLPMRVIALGLGRTGTTSTQTALEILGFPTYHATNIWYAPQEHIALWNRALDWKYGGSPDAQPLTRDEWDILLGNHSAGVDVPVAWFGAELAEIYPEAKFLIMARHDGPEAWFKSCVAAFGHRRQTWASRLFFKTIIYWDPRMCELARFMDKKQQLAWGFEWQEEGAKEKAVKWYEEYYDEMKRVIPKERRLEYTVKDEWGPLCEFLGVDVPVGVDETGRKGEVPFPRGNEAKAFTQLVKGQIDNVVSNGVTAWGVRIMVVATAWVLVSPYAKGPLNGAVGVLKGYLAK